MKKPFFTYVFERTYQKIAKPVFFSFDPEMVHDFFSKTGEVIGGFSFTRFLTKTAFSFESPSLEQSLWGIDFKNPVGLSAGFDKDGKLLDILPSVGFGFAEIGSVTLEPYDGNPKPRLWRLIKSKAIIVNYGLKSAGVKKFIKNVRSRQVLDFPFAVSVAKTNCEETCDEKTAILHYKKCLSELIKKDVGNFYVINISCPNTFGGEPFTSSRKLDSLLKELVKVRNKKAMLVKMPSNLEWSDFKGLLDVVIKHKLDGVIIGNLNKNFKSEKIKDTIPDGARGSISGKVVEPLVDELIGKTYQYCGDKLKIVGVGGVFSGKDAWEKIRLGSSLVSLITGMIFEGPQLIGQINRELDFVLKKEGYSNISEAVGSKFSKKRSK